MIIALLILAFKGHAVTAVTTTNPNVYYPEYTRIDLVCGQMPKAAQKDVESCCEAAFTGELLEENQSPAAEFNVGLVTAFSAIVREPVDSETMQKNMQKTIQKEAKTIQKSIQKDPETIQKAIQKALEERGITITDLQMDILVYFYLHPTATRNDYISSDKKLSEGGTISSITRLQELELLKRKGGKKNGEWIVAIDI